MKKARGRARAGEEGRERDEASRRASRKGVPRGRKDGDSGASRARGRRCASPASPRSSAPPSASFAFPERASPTTTRRCSPTVGRFTYKFNKHISYLMHALSRECFDRPGPPSSSSARFLLARPLASRRASARSTYPPYTRFATVGSSLTSFSTSTLHFQSSSGAACAGSTGGAASRAIVFTSPDHRRPQNHPSSLCAP